MNVAVTRELSISFPPLILNKLCKTYTGIIIK